MLSRTADHLFWMSRYTERAENTARMLSVSYETSLLPQAAAANRSVFFGANGAPRSLGQVMDLLRTRMTAAMGDAGSEFPFASPIESGWERGSQALGISPLPRIPGSEGISSPPRPSMAETLAAAFGGGGEAAMPGHVRAAYGRLKGLGL